VALSQTGKGYFYSDFLAFACYSQKQRLKTKKLRTTHLLPVAHAAKASPADKKSNGGKS